MKKEVLMTSNDSISAPLCEALFEMANLSPKRTGLPFVVWISARRVRRTTFV